MIDIRPVEGFEGLYTVTDDGWVYGTKRKKFLKQRLDECGYPIVYLSRNEGKTTKLRVHQVVARAFVENPAGKPQVNHKDGNKQNNSAANLEWMTSSENIRHAYDALGRKGSQTGKFGKEHPVSKAVAQYDRRHNKIMEFDSAKQASEVTGVDAAHIGCVASGKRQSAGGFIWRFI